jgi:hypothetical protein
MREGTLQDPRPVSFLFHFTAVAIVRSGFARSVLTAAAAAAPFAATTGLLARLSQLLAFRFVSAPVLRLTFL